MKKPLGPINCLYPMPTVLVGALVNGMSRRYWTLGQPLAKCWDVGKQLKR